MNYLAIYHKLNGMRELTQLNRLRMTYRIGRTLPIIRKAILDYLDAENQGAFNYPEEIKVSIMQVKDGEKVPVEYSCKEKYNLSDPLATLLYVDWLLKDPAAAILYSQQIDMVALPSREEVERHIDPRILALARKKEQEMIQSLESELDQEIEEESDSATRETNLNGKTAEESDW